uniref:Bm485, isoform b n=1 Tax=Brugia malayi TaxID=6279 RepID=A0A1I9G2M4_BRUMA|nr:Bm485, isoform b [Brugia malayi]
MNVGEDIVSCDERLFLKLESLINENRTSTVEAMQTSLDLKMNSVIQNVRSKTADNFKVYRKCVNGITSKGSYHCW